MEALKRPRNSHSLVITSYFCHYLEVTKPRFPLIATSFSQDPKITEFPVITVQFTRNSADLHLSVIMGCPRRRSAPGGWSEV